MEKLKQNTLEEATTDIGFAKATETPLTRQVQLDDGTTVTVEGVTPNKMASILKSTFVTPGEKAQIPSGEYIDGVVQKYNATVVSTEDEEEISALDLDEESQEPVAQDNNLDQNSENSGIETQELSDENSPVESDENTLKSDETNKEEENINE